MDILSMESLIEITGGIDKDPDSSIITIESGIMESDIVRRRIGGYAAYRMREDIMGDYIVGDSILNNDNIDEIVDNRDSIMDKQVDDNILEPVQYEANGDEDSLNSENILEPVTKSIRQDSIADNMIEMLVNKYQIKNDYLYAMRRLIQLISQKSDNNVYKTFMSEEEMKQSIINYINKSPIDISIEPIEYPTLEPINLPKDKIEAKKALYPHLKLIEEYYSRVTEILYEIMTKIE